MQRFTSPWVEKKSAENGPLASWLVLALAGRRLAGLLQAAAGPDEPDAGHARDRAACEPGFQLTSKNDYILISKPSEIHLPSGLELKKQLPRRRPFPLSPSRTDDRIRAGSRDDAGRRQSCGAWPREPGWWCRRRAPPSRPPGPGSGSACRSPPHGLPRRRAAGQRSGMDGWPCAALKLTLKTDAHHRLSATR